MESTRKRNWMAVLIVALCLTLGMLFVPNVALAAGTGSIQITSSTHNSTIRYAGTMIADADAAPIDSALNWNALKADSRFSGLDGNQLTKAVGDEAATDTSGTFVAQMAGLLTGTPSVSVTCDGGAVSVDNGWYLLVPENNSLRPLLVWVNGNAAAIGNKMDVPTLTKEVSQESIGFGENVDYTLNGRIPSTFDLHTTYKMTVTDKWDEHLTYNQGSVRAILKSGDTQTDITDKATLTIENDTFRAVFDDLKTTPAKAGDYVIITYTLNYSIPAETDSIVLSNVAFLSYPSSSDDGGEEETPPVEVTVYTFHINVHKTDADDTSLAGAVFGLKNETGDWIGTDGKFGNQANRAEFTSDSAGMITGIPAVKAGTYTLVEIKAPDGYVLPSNPESKIAISATDQNEARDLNVTSTGQAKVVSVDAATGTALLGVVNTADGTPGTPGSPSNPTNPSTPTSDNPVSKALSVAAAELSKTGDNIYPLLIATGIVVIAAGVVLIARRKRRQQNSK